MTTLNGSLNIPTRKVPSIQISELTDDSIKFTISNTSLKLVTKWMNI